jgi:hypothetical protein
MISSANEDTAQQGHRPLRGAHFIKLGMYKNKNHYLKALGKIVISYQQYH